MEAPEKIYIFDNPILDFTKLSVKQSNNDIEYVRKDAFIEKMGNFLSEKYLIKTKEPLRWVSVRQVVADFKKYMKGENE